MHAYFMRYKGKTVSGLIANQCKLKKTRHCLAFLLTLLFEFVF